MLNKAAPNTDYFFYREEERERKRKRDVKYRVWHDETQYSFLVLLGRNDRLLHGKSVSIVFLRPRWKVFFIGRGALNSTIYPQRKCLAWEWIFLWILDT